MNATGRGRSTSADDAIHANVRRPKSVDTARNGRPARRISSPTGFDKPRGLRVFSVLNSSPNGPADLVHIAYCTRRSADVRNSSGPAAGASRYSPARHLRRNPARLVGDRYTSPRFCRDLYVYILILDRRPGS